MIGWLLFGSLVSWLLVGSWLLFWRLGMGGLEFSFCGSGTGTVKSIQSPDTETLFDIGTDDDKSKLI